MIKFVLAITIFIISSQAISKEFTVAINSRDIYRFKNAQGQWQGIDIELVKEIFLLTPHTYKLVEMPWARILKSIEQGDVDITVSASITPERLNFSYFSNHPFRYNEHMIFGHKNKLDELKKIKTLADIPKTSIILGVLRAAVYSDSYNVLLNDPNFTKHLIYFDSDKNMSDIVVKGRVDAYIESEIEGNYFISKKPEYRENIIPIVHIAKGDESAGYLMFSKKTISPTLISEFDEALKTIYDNDIYEKIANKYKNAAHQTGIND